MEVRQLPRGRHRLTREEVTASQRGRMLEAMALAVRDKGYTGTAVADVVAGAGVSRETFYQHFADKEDCFLAAQTAGDRFACEALVAAISSMVTVRVAAGEFDALPNLRLPLVELARRLRLAPAARRRRASA